MKRTQRAPGRRPEAAAEGSRRAIFAQQGFDAVSLRAIAQRAGLTHGLLRHHFGSKEDVWLAVVGAANAEYHQALGVLERSEGDPLAQGRALMETLSQISEQHPDIARLLFHESVVGGPRLDAILRLLAPARERVTALLERLQSAGHFREHRAGDFFFFLVVATGAPFAFPALSRAMTGAAPSQASQAVLGAALFSGRTPAARAPRRKR
jgi:TetR/AcrR family transcriptional regulator